MGCSEAPSGDRAMRILQGTEVSTRPYLRQICSLTVQVFLYFSCVVALLVGCSNTEELPAPVLRFSAIPDQSNTELAEKFGVLAQHLSEALGIQVKYVPSTDYKASVEMFKNGDIHLAWFGGLTGVQARHAVPGALAIVQGKEDSNYYSYFIAHADTGLHHAIGFPHDIARFPFSFGSASSTSGRLMPEYFILRNTGKSPKEFFKFTPVFSGDHDTTVQLVESGRVQVGAVNYKVYDKRVNSGKTDPNICRIIWKTPVYSDYNFTVHPELNDIFDPEFIDRLQAALVAIKDPVILDAFPRCGLIKTSNTEFEQLKKIVEELGFL